MQDVYDTLGYSQAELQATMREHYEKIVDFITTDAFKGVMLEITTLPADQRPKFIAEVLLDKNELMARGIIVPDGILIQRSAFGDRRPTLFAVKHFLPEKFSDVWENVNITFDNEYLDNAVPRDKESCWREPIDPARQAEMMARNLDLEKTDITI